MEYYWASQDIISFSQEEEEEEEEEVKQEAEGGKENVP
jgi:hypothetical protein